MIDNKLLKHTNALTDVQCINIGNTFGVSDFKNASDSTKTLLYSLWSACRSPSALKERVNK